MSTFNGSAGPAPWCPQRPAARDTNLAPLLAALAADAHAAETEFFFRDLPPLEELASQLREDLRTAGLTRETLFANDETRRHIRFHDLRASGITWWALDGVPPLTINERAGHRNFSTTEINVRAGETVGANAGTPFPALTTLLGEGVASPDSDDDHNPDDGGGGGHQKPIPANYPRNRIQQRWRYVVASPRGFEPLLQP